MFRVLVRVAVGLPRSYGDGARMATAALLQDKTSRHRDQSESIVVYKCKCAWIAMALCAPPQVGCLALPRAVDPLEAR